MWGYRQVTTDTFTFLEEILKRNTSLFWVLAVPKDMNQWKCSNLVKNITPHIFLTPPIEVYTATNVKKNVATKFGKFSN